MDDLEFVVPPSSLMKEFDIVGLKLLKLQNVLNKKNGILLCPKHHKFGRFSAHKNPLWFINLLQDCDPETYNYLLNKLKDLK